MTDCFSSELYFLCIDLSLNSNLTQLLQWPDILNFHYTQHSGYPLFPFFEHILTCLIFIFLSSPKSDILPKKKRDVSNFDLQEFPNSTISRINLLSDADKNLESMLFIF